MLTLHPLPPSLSPSLSLLECCYPHTGQVSHVGKSFMRNECFTKRSRSLSVADSKFHQGGALPPLPYFFSCFHTTSWLQRLPSHLPSKGHFSLNVQLHSLSFPSLLLSPPTFSSFSFLLYKSYLS